MAFNLLQTVTDHLDDGLMGQISGLAGINKNQTSSALTSMLPTLIGGVINKGSTSEGAGSLLDLITKSGLNGGLLDNLGDVLGGDKSKGMMDTGNSLLSSIFGGNSGSILNILGKDTGLTRGSTGSLMSLLAPIVMNFIGRRVKNKALDAVGLKNMLSGQRDYVKGGIPADIKGMLGFAEKKEDKVAAATLSATSSATETAKTGGGGILKFLLPLAVIAAALWYFMGRGGDATTKDASTTTNTEATTKATGGTHTHADGTVHTGDHSHAGDAAAKVKNAAGNAAGAVKDAASDAADAVEGAAADAADAVEGAADEARVEAKLMVNAVGDLVDEDGKVHYKKGEFTVGENGEFLDKEGKRIRIFLDKIKDALKGAGDKIKGAGGKVKDAAKGAGDKIKGVGKGN